jgi:hypothetical protein
VLCAVEPDPEHGIIGIPATTDDRFGLFAGKLRWVHDLHGFGDGQEAFIEIDGP